MASKSKVAAAAYYDSLPQYKAQEQNWLSHNDVSRISHVVYNFLDKRWLNSTFSLNDILLEIKKDDKSDIDKNLLATLIDYLNLRENLRRSSLDNQKQKQKLQLQRIEEQQQRIEEQYPYINNLTIVLFSHSTDKFALFNSTKENIIKYFNTVLPNYLNTMTKHKHFSSFKNRIMSDIKYDNNVVTYVLDNYYKNEIFSNGSIYLGNFGNFDEPPGFYKNNNELLTKPLPSSPSGGSRRRLSKHKKTKKAKKHLKKS